LDNSKVKYLGFGSPLMDIISDVSEDTIKKYDLKLDSTIHTKIVEHPLFKNREEELCVEHVAGGCSYNAMRVFNWMLEDKHNDCGKTGVLGSVGNDFYAELYTKLLENEKIVPIFERFDDIITGICLVFCHNRDRGHITDLGASVLISMDFVNRMFDLIKDVQLVYTELFILKHRKDIVYVLAELCLDNNKIFGFNLPSHYFIETFLEDIKVLLQYVDVLFANKEEAKFLVKLLDINYDEDDMGSLSVGLINWIEKKNKNKKLVVVVTCGPNPAYCIEKDSLKNAISFFNSYVPVHVNEENIIDTNGAGDAFAGGFLSRFVKGRKLEDCMAAGHWAAAEIIQDRGCQIPYEKTFKGF